MRRRARPANFSTGKAVTMEERLRSQRRVLAERVKELECLFTVSRIFNQPGVSFLSMLSRLCSAVQSAWHFPKKTRVRIVVRHEEVRSAGFRESDFTLKRSLTPKGKKLGFIEVCYLGDLPPGETDAFLSMEKRLLSAIAELTENMLVRKDTEREIKRTSARLQEQRRLLERKNIALKEVLAQIEIEKKQIREQFFSEIQSSILPVVHKLGNAGMPVEQRKRYADILARDLAGIGSTVSSPISSLRIRLSPREVEIADLARGGSSSKEIARLLHISEPTVERHRHNIRRKLGIKGVKVNLATYLSEGA